VARLVGSRAERVTGRLRAVLDAMAHDLRGVLDEMPRILGAVFDGGARVVRSVRHIGSGLVQRFVSERGRDKQLGSKSRSSSRTPTD
jgi:hypothetical protein